MALTAALILIAMLATGLAPALYASSPALAQILGSELVVGGPRKAVRRNALVIVQVGVCTLVLMAMGICLRSLYNLRHVDPGFTARNLVAAQIYPNMDDSDVRGKELSARLRNAVAAIPGVEAVSLGSNLPLYGASPVPVQFPDSNKPIQIQHVVGDADYFATFGIPVLRGRAFESSDRETGPDVVMINRKMAEMFWPHRKPSGKLSS
ncbi:MAG: ABC transporter permease [Bryobacteraceae bacterium]|jgi:hypothetical protein